MNFNELKNEIFKSTSMGFEDASLYLEKIILKLPKKDLENLIIEIGTIPEDIGHDSTEEKLYTKVSDILFAAALISMNFSVKVLRTRADCADVVAQSKYWGYSLVGDAKAFRLSRTAKNAKDFKVISMDHWRGDSEFSVLTCPFFHYPKNSSQIYKDALDHNIMLFSWECLYVFLKENIRETGSINLYDVWNQSAVIAKGVRVPDSKNNFLNTQNHNLAKIIGITDKKMNEYFFNVRRNLIKRGESEIYYYENEINRIKRLNREDAINELLVSMKLDNKISTIKQFIEQIRQ